MDAWRIKNDLEIFNLGVLDFLQESIFLIEWANKIDAHLPVNKLSITLEYGKTFRTICFMGIKTGKKDWTKILREIFLKNNLDKNLLEFLNKVKVPIKNVFLLKSDASKRRYYRTINKENSFLVMDSSLEKISLSNFIKISDWLKIKGYSVPEYLL